MRKNDLILRCIDGILNGAIPRCPRCSTQGRGNRSYLTYDKETGYYLCNGTFDPKAQRKLECDFYSQSVMRKPWRTSKTQ